MPRTAGGRDLGFTIHEVVKTTEWNGFTAGDRVSSSAPGCSGLSLEFLCHGTNIRTGAAWVELWGGTGKNVGIQTVPPNTVSLKVDKRRRQ